MTKEEFEEFKAKFTKFLIEQFQVRGLLLTDERSYEEKIDQGSKEESRVEDTLRFQPSSSIAIKRAKVEDPDSKKARQTTNLSSSIILDIVKSSRDAAKKREKLKKEMQQLQWIILKENLRFDLNKEKIKADYLKAAIVLNRLHQKNLAAKRSPAA